MTEGGGGAATASGMNFQALASAWYASAILGESDVPPPLGLAAGTRLTWLMCETGEPVDDLLVSTSANGFIFAQAKNSISLGEAATSEFASVVDQFVRQFMANRSQSTPKRKWNRTLDPAIDRLVLIAGPDSPSTVRDALPAVLEKVRVLAGRPIKDAPTNADEERALRVLRGHIGAAWQSATAQPPTLADELTLLSLIRVQVLDLRDDGPSEREARGVLRRVVLEDPDSDALALTLLSAHCSELAARHGSADRFLLLQVLSQHGLSAKVPHTYRSDIDKLKAYSARCIELLSELSTISCGGVRVKVERKCTAELMAAALKEPVLVTGDPGAGKSGALHELAVASAEHADRLVLLVDRLSAKTLKELSDELGLEHDLIDTLKNWSSQRPGIILIDALDAARDEAVAQTIRDLIQLVMPLAERWRVVASIRKFDLRYGEALKRLFLGAPPSAEFVEREFSSIRHINVPKLSDAELQQIGEQAPVLGELVVRAPSALRELLRVPFNVRLMADLLNDGVASVELTPIRTQPELLDRYWSHRIIGSDGAGDRRENALRAACEAMIETRGLQIDRSLLSSQAPEAMNALLSGHVLAEWSEPTAAKPNRYIVHFSHHVLYDYSVARLLMRGSRTALLQRLTDPDFVLLVRPSIGLHFQHLWGSERAEFWELSLELLRRATGPKTLELVGPTVATQGVLDASEFEPLFKTFESHNDELKAGESFFAHVAGAILADELPVVGPAAKPWCQVIERLSLHPTRSSAFAMRALVISAMEKLKEATPGQLKALGAAARNMLSFVLDAIADVPQILPSSIQAVCRTFSTEPTESEALLRRFIDPARINERGYFELPWLAREIAPIFQVTPSFARDVYVAAFTHRENSTAETQMGSGQILALTSNRRQDFDSALWSLSEAYPGFIVRAPVEATEALVTAVAAYVERRHRFARRSSQTFEFRGRTLELLTDFSDIWDSGSTYSHDDAVKMLDAFEERVEQLSDVEDSGTLERILDALARANPVAVVWKRLLSVAARERGDALARLLQPMLETEAILTGQDTLVPVGQLLKVRAADLERAARARIETTILALPDRLEDEERGAYLRARLLGCIPYDALVLDDARKLVDLLREKNEIPPNTPTASWRSFSGEYTEETHLKELGVDPDAPRTAQVVDLTKPVRQFAADSNRHPSLAEVRGVVPQLEALVDLLASEESDELNNTFRNYTWGYVAAAAAVATRCSELSGDDPAAQQLLGYLLYASKNEEPHLDVAQEQQFDSSPGWGSPAARIDAAIGLMSFARLKGGVTEEIKTAARRLAFDDVAAVRFQVAVRLLYLYEEEREFVWKIASDLAEREQNRGVLLGLVGHTLGRLTSVSEDEGLRLLRQIYQRLPRKAERDEIHRQIISVVAQLFAYRGNASASQMVREAIENSVASPRPAQEMLFALRKALIYGTDKDLAVRQRAIKIYRDLLGTVDPALRKLESNAVQWTDEQREQARELASIVQDISDQVYFASGAFETKKRTQGQTSEDADIPDEDESRRFYREADELLSELSRVRLAGAAHKVVETLAFFAPLDPEGVFVRIAECVRSGRAAGYQFESLAASLVVNIVERYLADYRRIFRDNNRCRRDLLELLDTFVEAGWPSARKLTYKLDEIFR